MSDYFPVSAGIRQGGILSASLFIVYVDDMLRKLSAYGCNLVGHLVGAIMYADDLALISPSIRELQIMLDICQDELKILDLRINVTKSVCLRMGKRYDKTCCNLRTYTGILPWTTEARYLGVHLTAGIKFGCNFASSKVKFYRSANAIIGKLGSQRNPTVTMELVSSVSLPILLYGAESLCLNKSDTARLEHPWSRIFMKVYATFDNNVVNYCQLYSGFLPLSYINSMRKVSFINKLPLCDNAILSSLYDWRAITEIQHISAIYNSTAEQFQHNYRNILREHFYNTCMS
jgi:hypothetical protein